MTRFHIIARTDPYTALEVKVFSGITREEYLITNAKWRAYKNLYCPDPLNPPANHHWNWHHKSSEETFGESRFLVLKYAGEIEGMAMLSNTPRASRMPGFVHEEVLNVEYLESAPWNQKAYAGRQARFWGVGTCLISIAIEVSERLGCEGRLGLHSLEEAKGFYLEQGFVNLGYDSLEKLDYFELSGKALIEQES